MIKITVFITSHHLNTIKKKHLFYLGLNKLLKLMLVKLLAKKLFLLKWQKVKAGFRLVHFLIPQLLF